jgi:N-acetylneuraminic acid mutarotase
MGGYDGEKVLSSCEFLSSQSLEWEQVGEMSSKRMYFSSICYDDQVIIMGGINENEQILSTMEKYNS